ncbi:verprolin-like [Miscanthus floridulus]|uniref:verprolin-like n=1 Tax=Miscanthus floridulus TaxID=154761 RepID=UPI003458082F
MEMEGSGGSQSQLTHPAVDVNEAALDVTKRERKRSRYLSPPYTDTGVQEKKAAGSRKQREEEEGPPHVSASEVLSALRAAALGQGEGMDAAARFLAMYSRNRNSIFVDDPHAAAAGGGGSQDDGGDKPPSAAGVGRKMLNLNAGLDDGSLAKKKNPNPKNPHPPAAVAVAAAGANAKQQKDGIMENAAPAVPEHAIATHGASQSADFAAAATHGHPNPPVVTTAIPPINNEKNPNPKNPHPPAAVAAAGANAKQQKDDGTMENAAVPEHAITTHGASQSAGFAAAAAAATHGHPNPPVVTTATPPININNEKRKMNKKRTMKTVGNPVALVLDFAEGTPLPSREDLLSTFSRFGFVIDSETTISQDKHTAQVAFATRVQAETALSCAATLGGAFGPPFAVASLQDLPPITLNTPPPPLPKLPLTDIRNNLGKMILSLSSKATAAPQEANAKTAVDSLCLVGDMQRLLAKVDKVLQVQGASATAHHA